MSYEQNDKILKGFVLSSDALFEIRRLMERRPRSRFSDGLSSEAKLAMEQTREDTLLMFDGYDENPNVSEEDFNESSEKQISRRRVQSPRKRPSKGNSKSSKKQISFNEQKNDENMDKLKKSSAADVNMNVEEPSSDKVSANDSDKYKESIEDIGDNAEKQVATSESPLPEFEYRLPKK